MSEQPARYDASGTRGVCVVGIDPGAVTGLAVWDVEARRLVECTSAGFFGVQALLAERAWPAGGLIDGVPPACENPWAWRVGLVVVEDSRPLPIYARRDNVQGRARDRVCRNVGRVDRDCELWEAWLSERGFAVTMRVPGRGSKWDAETLEAIAGWAAPTNQHGRDAARLVVGLTARHVERWGQAA